VASRKSHMYAFNAHTHIVALVFGGAGWVLLGVRRHTFLSSVSLLKQEIC
jgi:hypothetical protein